MATELDRAIAKVRQTGGLSQAEKKAIVQQLKRDASKSGNLGAGDRKRMNQAIRTAKADNPGRTTPTPTPPGSGPDANNPNAGGGNSTAPGAPVEPPVDEVTETPTNVARPTTPANEGYMWEPTVGEGGFITGWSQVPIPGYKPPTTPVDNSAEKRATAETFLKDLLGRFGLESLAGSVSQLITTWGTNSDVIAVKLKETQQYKDRFKGNLDRVNNGLNMLTEAEYLATEDAIATRMRLRGMGSGFQSRSYIANLIAKDVSAAEVDDRLNQAQRVVENADPMVIDSLRRLYGASIGDLYGYVLDADTAIGDIEKKVNAGLTARLAEQSGLQIGRGLSEQIGQMTGGNEQALRPTFQRISTLADSTKRLSALEGMDGIDDEDVVEGELGYNQESREKVRKLQSRERARFSGQSGAFRGTLGGNNSY